MPSAATHRALPTTEAVFRENMQLPPKSIALNPHPFDLIKADLIRPPIISCVVRVEPWFAIATAVSSIPPFLRQAVIPVAGKV